MAFYNNGGGVGHGLNISNQTLSADSIGLDKDEVEAIIAFMKSLDEKFTIDPIPASLPISSKKVLNSRKPGGEY
jgi:hypothetical protein